MKKYIISIDQGTTSTRAILFDQQQNIVAVSQEEIHNSFPQPGWVEQDANEIWLSTLSCLSSLFLKSGAQPDEVASIGITNQRETTIVWEKQPESRYTMRSSGSAAGLQKKWRNW